MGAYHVHVEKPFLYSSVFTLTRPKMGGGLLPGSGYLADFTVSSYTL